MNLTARQVELLNSTNPKDNPELLASVGGDQQLLAQLVNMFGPGGSQYNATNYGHTSSSVGSQPEPMFANIYKQLGYMDANGNMLKHQDNNGNWVDGANVGNFQATTVDPGQSWSGTNAQGGFTGGTGVGVTSGAFNSNTGAPMSLAELTAALNPTRPTPGAPAGGPTQPANPRTTPGAPGSPVSGGGTGTPGAGGGTTPGTGGTGSVGGGSTANGNTGDTGGFPMASASTYTPKDYGKYTAPTRPDDASTPWDFFNDKGYQFALKEGKDAAENSAAARGSLLSGNTLKELSDRATGTASQFYGDAYNRWMGNKQFSEGQYNSDRNFGANQFNTDRSFGYNSDTNARDYNNANRMWDSTFNNNNRIDARNFDYTAAIGDRDFNEGVRRYDQGFNYNAENTDANRNTETLRFLAGLGANANNSSGSFYAQLANLLSQNGLTGAGAGAAGNQGGANSLTNIFNALMPYLMGNGTPVTNPGKTQ